MKFHPKPIIYGIGLLLLQHSVYALAGFEDDVLGVKKLPIASKAKAVNRYTGSTGSRRSIVDAADVDINNNNNNNGDTVSAISTNGFQSDVLGVHLPGTGTPITSNTSHHQSPRRRRLTSIDSIINALNDDVAKGILKPSFTMVVDVVDTAAGTDTGTDASEGGIGQSDFGSGEGSGNIFDFETSPSDASNINDGTTPSSFEIDVTLANPSVTKSTTYSIHGGPSRPITNILNLDDTTLLVSSKLDEDGSTSRSGDFCILAVNSTAGSVEGIIKKNGWSLMNLESNLDESTVKDESVVTKLVAREVVVEDREWACGVEEGGTSGGRMLHEDHDHEHHDHGHHSHHHHDHSDPNFDFLSNLNANLGSKLGSNAKVQFSSRNLRSRGHDTNNTDSDSANRRLYATDNFPDLYSYQVDLYIEIDQGFVDNHGSMDAAITYVNVLVTAISSIYEEEIDTHLNVLHIALSIVYDAVTNTQEAIDLMKETYAADTWHYKDGSHDPDLHHAFIFRSIGGGIASLKAVCSSQIGYGVSSGMVGSLAQAQSGAMYWVRLLKLCSILIPPTIFSNVLCYNPRSAFSGHNFGAYHTHDANAWDPLIDSCGLNTCNGVSTGEATEESQTLLYRLEDIGMRGIETISTIGQTILVLYRLEPTPNELPNSCYSPFGMMFNVQASNDIILTSMSVQLSNGASNVVTVYTARGTYADKATNPASWTQVFSSSFDVSDWDFVTISFEDITLINGTVQTFYVASTNEIIATNPNPTDDNLASDRNLLLLSEGRYLNDDATEFGGASSTPFSCDCYMEGSCTTKTCNRDTGKCLDTLVMEDNCCGNGICEVGESECASDCGPFQVVTPGCSSCYVPEGMMFDVEAVNDIILTSLNVQLSSGTNDVTVYTASRTYNEIKFTSASWTQVFTQNFSVSDRSLVSIDFNDIELSRGDIQAFYVATTGQVTATGDTTNPLANDENLKLLNPGRGVGSVAFGGGYSNVISW
ncbi:predicted protein [Thalassiosira pseudonana CCMP1335]|uniref:Uncharacterized protein n=1 Tax=Thalassiosira pseudonana TaxID=35128 RepID=B8C8W5_THAPS|nr:predicted protein [Thalassiosira pseudonana CCMP1335]EED89945.1 predicted protein [Thalassiosira pseudonana CCMP1335]